MRVQWFMTDSFQVDKLEVEVFASREALGVRAARQVAAWLHEILEKKETASVVFAAAPSQNEFLAALLGLELPWHRIHALHMDEYVGLSGDDPASFQSYLREHLFDHVAFESVDFLQGDAEDLQAECERYAGVLEKRPPDLVCAGIGENTHLAFNDPPVADFADPKFVKVVELDRPCREQQVNDGCFPSLDKVPTHALTLTIPALMQSRYLSCVVPGATKADAVVKTLQAEVSSTYPATVLRGHSSAKLFLDKESAAQLEPQTS